MNEFADDVRKLIENKQLTVVIGSGVSRATCSQSPDWRGLIESGIQRCETFGLLDEDERADDWCGTVRSLLSKRKLEMLLSAAEQVQLKLTQHGEFGLWLRESFESLKAEPNKLEVLETIARFEAPLVTTNYDGLIEQVTGLRPVTWLDPTNAMRFVRKDHQPTDRRVLHLHGHWEQPESVVLGVRSYEAVTQHQHTQKVMELFGTATSFLFVGCGQEGLSDPNWGPFLDWLTRFDVDNKHEHRHYVMVRDDDAFEPRGRIFPLKYGKKFEHLAGFLMSLLPTPVAQAARLSFTRKNDHALKPGEAVEPRALRNSTPAGEPAAKPPSVQAYLKRLADQTKSLTMTGLGGGVHVVLPIVDAYVPLRTQLCRSMRERDEVDRFKDGRAEFGAGVDVELCDVFTRCRDGQQRGALLLGEPGAGKTTGARQLAWKLASGQSWPQDFGLPAGLTPVLLKFRNLSAAFLAAGDAGLRQFLLQETHASQARSGEQDPGPELWDLASGLLWILDGLDEVMDPKARANVVSWVRQALDQRPHDWFLVTSRFQGYDRRKHSLGSAFAEFEVKPLDHDQIESFVSKWFGVVYGQLKDDKADAQARAAADTAELLRLIKLSITQPHQYSKMAELSANPMLLTILCIVFLDKRQLPTGRAELYAQCIQVLLQEWRQEVFAKQRTSEQPPYDAKAAQSVLAQLAWWMHQEQDRTVAPLEELAAEATQALATLSPSAGLGLDGLRFIHRMREEAGLLALSGEGDGRCGFLHKTFQEYLAAEYAATTGKAQFLAQRVTQPWWQEAALLSLRQSRSHCADFFREMLKVGLPEMQPLLADQCLNEALYFVAEPFVQTVKRKSTKPERRAAVLRMLRSRAAQVPELKELLESRNNESLAPSPRYSGERAGVRGDSSHAADPSPPTPLPGVPGRGEPHRQPGDLWTDDRTGITYVWIPAGQFVMGSDKGRDDEKPAHRVTISKPFWLARYPVTNAQYARYMAADFRSSGGSPESSQNPNRDNAADQQASRLSYKSQQPAFWNDRRFNQPEQPVVGVSWDDAVAFAKWAQGRLPTEAEWEYACRAGTTTEYSFGDDAARLGEYAWFGNNSDQQTQPVGTKMPNAWGLYDMHGNVWEWCQDYYNSGYYKQSPEVDPAGPSMASYRVFRGGSWGHGAANCRSACRISITPDFRLNDLGFRLALGPELK